MGPPSCVQRQDQGDTQELISTRDGGPDQNHGDTSGGADVDHTYQPSRTDMLWKKRWCQVIKMIKTANVTIFYGWLWLIMVDYGWLWLTMADYGWLWLVMVDYGWLWLIMVD